MKETLWWFVMGILLLASIVGLTDDIEKLFPHRYHDVLEGGVAVLSGGLLVACIVVMTKKAIKTFAGKKNQTEGP